MKLNTTIISILTILACTVNSVQVAAQDSKKQAFRITVVNTEGNPQAGMILKITGYNGEYVGNEQGIIEFEREINKKNIRTANLYFPSDKQKPVKTMRFDESLADTIIRIDSQEDIIRYKQNARTFPIEGIVQCKGRPVANAEVIIQGTGRRAFTDRDGKFAIEADYNHSIMIRAEKMENKYMDVDLFLMNPDKPYTINMTRKSSDRIYTSAEQMPKYPGGMKAFFNYLKRKTRSTELAEQTQTEGTVIVQFVVEKDGSITSPRIVRGLHALLDTAALEAIVVMRDWIPAKDHGMTVRCKYSVPVTFKLPKPIVPEPEPVVTLPKDSLRNDSIANDSIPNDSILNDSIMPILPVMESDSLQTDTLKKELTLAADSLQADSIISQQADTLQADLPEHLPKPSATEVKPKKQNAFVRFFRRLFGIKDKNEEVQDAPPVHEMPEIPGQETIPDMATNNETVDEQQNDIE